MKQAHILLFLLLCSLSLFGQLQKGDWLLGEYNQVGNRQSFISSLFPTTQIDLSNKIGVMINDHRMLGVKIGAIGMLNKYISSPEQFIHYDLNVFTRNYIDIKRSFLPFFELELGYERHREQSFIKDVSEIFKIDIEVGAMQFIAPNIALEVAIGARLVENGSTIITGTTFPERINTEKFYAEIGLKTFLKTSFIQPIDIRDNYFKKGNYIITGNALIRDYKANEIELFFDRNLAFLPEKTGIQLSLFPKIKYFKTDYLTIGGGLDFDLLTTGAGRRVQSGIHFESGIYLPLKRNFFFAPTVGMAYNRIKVNAEHLVPGLLSTTAFVLAKETSSIQMFKIPVDVSFQWFLGRKMILSFGSLYAATFSESITLGDGTSVDVTVYSGLEYFFAPNLSLQTKIVYNKNISQTQPATSPVFISSSVLDSTTDFIFALSYFIFR